MTAFNLDKFIKHSSMDLEALNAQLRRQSPAEIIRWALSQNQPLIASTSFGPNSALLLQILSTIDQSIPIVWADSGYNMRDTYVVAEALIKRLNLAIHIEVPSITCERLNVIFGGIPTLAEPEEHKKFTRIVKLDPFERALNKFKPKIWISGIRKSDNAFRNNLDILSIDHQNILKVAPIFYWTDEQVTAYMQEHELPSCRHYFDPTKAESDRECGLHTL